MPFVTASPGAPRAATVTVIAKRVQNQVEIRVADDGVGLPPGWTLETSSGMGLSVTRERIVGLHPDGSGRFSVRPRPGGGTEVEISLPLRFARRGSQWPSPLNESACWWWMMKRPRASA